MAYQVCSHDHPRLTLTYLTSRSNLLPSLLQTFMITWPIWPPCPYKVKTLYIFSSPNQKANDLETWYVAMGM